MLLLALACSSTPAPVAVRLPERPAAVTGPTLAVGGDVNLGRRSNALIARSGPEAPLGAVSALRAADLAYANLECVVATSGDYRAEKGESGPYYYRARPEHLAVLQHAGIDVVGTANNHVGDYGPPAVLEQAAFLDAVGLAHPGSGADRDAACAPVFRRAGDLVLAFYAVEATMAPFASAADRPGTCYLDPEDPDAWGRFATDAVAAARDRAHLVLLGVHWGDNNVAEPTPALRKLARAVMAGGFDAVLGSSAHLVHGVEIIDGRPVIYDAGNLLFDAKSDTESALFELTLSAAGVRQVRITPLHADFGTTRTVSGPEATAMLDTFASRSLALGTSVWVGADELIIPLPEPPERAAPSAEAPPVPPTSPARPAEAPGPQCLAAEVPADAAREPVKLGALTLVGWRVGPAQMPKRQMVDVETWWRVEAPPTTDLLLDVYAAHAESNARWGGEHDGCDWSWPTSRWVPGQLYYDRYALRPAPRPRPGRYTVKVGVGERPLGPSKDAVELGVVELAK